MHRVRRPKKFFKSAPIFPDADKHPMKHPPPPPPLPVSIAPLVAGISVAGGAVTGISVAGGTATGTGHWVTPARRPKSWVQ
jgi:hypothetical protein